MPDFKRPFALQFHGSAVARRLLALFGWQVEFDGLPAQQGVLVVYPHTSTWDLVVMMLAKWSIGVQVQFWGKASLFQIPVFGRWLRWVGGVPVDRSAARGAVGQMAELLRARRQANQYFWLGLSPEGSRKAGDGWRSGFYFAAVQADVPLGLVRLDYALRKVVVRDFIKLSGDPATDFARMADIYAGVVGRLPANVAPVKMLVK
jgi:1-acyl-sn-glycerol-3-phosphate acyltransferase